MKLVGAIIIISVGIFIGLTKAQELSQRIEELKIFRDFLTILKTKISFSALSIGELIISSTENNFARLLSLQNMDIPVAFKNVSTEFFSSPKDNEVALSFISEFGRSDIENQMESIEMYICLFDRRILEAAQIYKEKSKVNLMIYSFIGVAVALVLI